MGSPPSKDAASLSAQVGSTGPVLPSHGLMCLGNWPSVHTTSESPLSWLVISHDIGKPCDPGLPTSHICPTTGIDFVPPGSSQSLVYTSGHLWELLHIHSIHLVPSPLPPDC